MLGSENIGNGGENLGNLASGVKVATGAPKAKVSFHNASIMWPQDEYKILVNNGNTPFEHEQSKRRLEDREKELRAREAVNDIEKKKLDSEKKMNQLMIMEQKKADERMLKLAEDQKR